MIIFLSMRPKAPSANSSLTKAGLPLQQRVLRPRGAAIIVVAALVALLGGGPPAAARSSKKGRAARAQAAAPTRGLVWHVETLGGDVVDSRQGDEPINPASVVKVATTLWALEQLGPQHRFETRFLTTADAALSGDELVGDLLVAGGGDPDFQAENALLVARELNEMGIRRVRGDLVVNREFWIGWEGGSAHRMPDPEQRALLMGTRLRQAFDARRWNGALGNAWRRLAERRGFDAQRPPRLVITGRVRIGAQLDGRRLVVHRARPLVQTLRRLNCYSNNDIERVEASLGRPEDLRRWLTTRWGLPAGALQLETTSGLGENRLTPRQVVGLLRDLRRTSERLNVGIEGVLPTVGCDPGTVSHFYHKISNGPAATSVVGKTGTLTATDGGISVFAGFASTARGELIFCVAVPRAAGRLRQARWKEEQWVLDLVNRHGGPLPRVCATPLTGPDDGAVVEGDPAFVRPLPSAASYVSPGADSRRNGPVATDPAPRFRRDP